MTFRALLVLTRRPSREVARVFGYSPGSFQVLCHHFHRASDPVFFVAPSPRPRDQLKVDFDMPATVDSTESEVQVRFHRRAHLPIVLASGLLAEPVTVRSCDSRWGGS